MRQTSDISSVGEALEAGIIGRAAAVEYAEADALVLFGNQAIVVQAKSKRLTLNARKGNDLALRDDFKKAVAKAYDQALLCADALQRPTHFVFRDAQGQELTIAGPFDVNP